MYRTSPVIIEISPFRAKQDTSTLRPCPVLIFLIMTGVLHIIPYILLKIALNLCSSMTRVTHIKQSINNLVSNLVIFLQYH